MINIYDCLTEIYEIENYFYFTDKMKFFFDEQSFLWRFLIRRKLEERLREEEYKNYENKIEKEISDLEQIKDFSWPDEIYNRYREILNSKLEEILNKIEV